MSLELTRTRQLLRRAGVLETLNRARTWPERRRRSSFQSEYERSGRPKHVESEVLGQAVSFEVEDAGAYAIAKSGREPAVTKQLARRVRHGDTVVDVGAAWGAFSIPLAKAVGEDGAVYAVEPQPLFRERLLANARLNRLNNVVLVPVAFDRHDGTTVMRETANGGPLEVELREGDAWLEREGISPDVLKIDVEGMEYPVLRGLECGLRRCHTCIVEVHSQILAERGKEQEPKEITAYLETIFPRVRWIDTSHIAATREQATP